MRVSRFLTSEVGSVLFSDDVILVVFTCHDLQSSAELSS